MNSVEQVNITSEPNKIKVNYEIKENDYICGPDEKNEVDNILNNECFFSDSNQETKWYDDIDDNLMSQHIDYFENYNLKQLHHISNYYNIPKRKLKKEIRKKIQSLTIFKKIKFLLFFCWFKVSRRKSPTWKSLASVWTRLLPHPRRVDDDDDDDDDTTDSPTNSFVTR